jgi:hypothetical protein
VFNFFQNEEFWPSRIELFLPAEKAAWAAGTTRLSRSGDHIQPPPSFLISSSPNTGGIDAEWRLTLWTILSRLGGARLSHLLELLASTWQAFTYISIFIKNSEIYVISISKHFGIFLTDIIHRQLTSALIFSLLASKGSMEPII